MIGQSSGVQKLNRENELILHHSLAETATAIQKYFTEICRNVLNASHFSFDFQADIHLPLLVDQPTFLFRSRKLNIRNFGTADHVSRQMVCLVFFHSFRYLLSLQFVDKHCSWIPLESTCCPRMNWIKSCSPSAASGPESTFQSRQKAQRL